MPILVDLRTGKQVRVSDAETQSLLATRNFGFPSSRVNLVTPSGEVKSTLSDNPIIHDALANGYRIESPEEENKRFNIEKYGDRGLEAAAAGVARGTSFGLSDLLLTKSGLVDDKTLAGLREENPGASAAGEIGGVAGSLLIPGGVLARLGGIGKAVGSTGAAVRGVEALGVKAGQTASKAVEGFLKSSTPGSSALARALTRGTELATQGIVEGAFYGAGELVSEYALGDTDLNAERVLSSIGASSAISAALGGSMGAIIGASSPITQKFKQKIIDNINKIPGIKQGSEDLTRELANEAALRSVGASTRLIRNLHKQGLVEVGPETMLKLKHPDGKPVLRFGAKYDEISDRLDETVADIGQKIGEPINVADGLDDGSLLIRDIARDIEVEILDPLKNNPSFSDVKAKLKSYIDDLKEIGDQPATPKWLHSQRVGMQDAYSGQGTPIRKEIQKVERLLNNELETKLHKNLGEEAFQEFKENKKIFHAIKEIQKQTADRRAVLESNRWFSLSDRITGASASGGLLAGALVSDNDDAVGRLFEATAYGMGAAGIAKVFRQRGASAIAVMLDKASRMMSAEKYIDASKKAEKSAVTDFVNKFTGKRAGKTRQEVATERRHQEKADRIDSLPESSRKEVVLKILDVPDVNVNYVPTSIVETLSPTPALPRIQSLDQFAALDAQKSLPGPSLGVSSSDDFLTNDPSNNTLLSQNPVGKPYGQDALDVAPGPTQTEASNEMIDSLWNMIPKKEPKFPSLESSIVMRKTESKPKSYRIDIENGNPKPNHQAKQYVVEQISKIQNMSNPEAQSQVAQKVANALVDVAPEISSHIIRKIVSIMAFLSSKAPQPPPQNILQPQFENEWEPSSAETIRFLRYMIAANDPLSVLDSIANGTINAEGVETMRTLYPILYAEVLKKIVEGISESKNQIPYNKRVTLGLMFNLPITDVTLQGDFFNLLRDAAQQAPGYNQQPMNNSNKQTAITQNAINLIDPSMTATGSQRISEGLQ